MSLHMQKIREMVFQMLFCRDCSESRDDDLIALIMEELKVSKKNAREAMERVMQIMILREFIDEKIRIASTEYQFERISQAEKNILRLGVYEMIYDDTIEEKVAIAEAIRLCRKFGTPESARFVNAILDSIYQGTVCASKEGFVATDH